MKNVIKLVMLSFTVLFLFSGRILAYNDSINYDLNEFVNTANDNAIDSNIFIDEEEVVPIYKKGQLKLINDFLHRQFSQEEFIKLSNLFENILLKPAVILWT